MGTLRVSSLIFEVEVKSVVLRAGHSCICWVVVFVAFSLL